MKNSITQLSIVLIAFTALTFLMSYTRPAEEAPKQYMVVWKYGTGKGLSFEALQQDVNQKLSEGWHVQGGITTSGGTVIQALVK